MHLTKIQRNRPQVMILVTGLLIYQRVAVDFVIKKSQIPDLIHFEFITPLLTSQPLIDLFIL